MKKIIFLLIFLFSLGLFSNYFFSSATNLESSSNSFVNPSADNFTNFRDQELNFNHLSKLSDNLIGDNGQSISTAPGTRDFAYTSYDSTNSKNTGVTVGRFQNGHYKIYSYNIGDINGSGASSSQENAPIVSISRTGNIIIGTSGAQYSVYFGKYIESTDSYVFQSIDHSAPYLDASKTLTSLKLNYDGDSFVAVYSQETKKDIGYLMYGTHIGDKWKTQAITTPSNLGGKMYADFSYEKDAHFHYEDIVISIGKDLNNQIKSSIPGLYVILEKQNTDYYQSWVHVDIPTYHDPSFTIDQTTDHRLLSTHPYVTNGNDHKSSLAYEVLIKSKPASLGEFSNDSIMYGNLDIENRNAGGGSGDPVKVKIDNPSYYNLDENDYLKNIFINPLGNIFYQTSVSTYYLFRDKYNPNSFSNYTIIKYLKNIPFSSICSTEYYNQAGNKNSSLILGLFCSSKSGSDSKNSGMYYAEQIITSKKSSKLKSAYVLSFIIIGVGAVLFIAVLIILYIKKKRVKREIIF